MLKTVAALAFLLTCAPAQELTRHEFESPQMGTLFKIILYAKDADTAKKAADSAFDLAAKLNESFSDYEADSELRLLIEKGETKVSPELFDILTIAKQISEATEGAFDITTGAHTRNWRRARITNKLPSDSQIGIAKATSGWKKLTLNPETRNVTLSPGMQLDLGGIAKGYAADAMLALLKKAGFPIASVAAGGDIVVGDPPPARETWTIALSPDGKKSTRSIELSNQAVSTSGDAEQAITIEGNIYSHIVDPNTGLGLTQSFPVSVIAKSATLSDAFATAFSVMGENKAKSIADKKRLRVIWAKPPK